MPSPYPPGTYPDKLYRDIHGADVAPAPGGKPLKYIPSGAIDGVNKNYTFPVAPPATNFQIFWNGLLQNDGDDYTLSGNILTMVLAPSTGDKLIAYF